MCESYRAYSGKKIRKLVPVAICRNLNLTLKLKLKTANFHQTQITYRSYIYYILSLVRLAIFKLQGKIYEKYRRKSAGWDDYEHHT